VHRSLGPILFALVTLAPATLAQAQRGGRSDLRLGIGMVLDFAGGVEYDPPGLGSFDDTPRATPGLRLHLDYDVHRYVSIGGMFRLSFWRADDLDDARNLLVDLAFRLNGHYDWRDFRFYGAFAIGPTINRLNDDNIAGLGLDNPGMGVIASLTPGVEWWFSRRAGLYMEIFGWNGHFIRHGIDDAPGRTHIRLNQVLWQFGVVIGL
jgi:hypothetical protein